LLTAPSRENREQQNTTQTLPSPLHASSHLQIKNKKTFAEKKLKNNQENSILGFLNNIQRFFKL